MSYNLFYFQPEDTALTATQLKQKTGINYTENIANETLNRAKVYPVNEIADPYNPALYTTVLSYTINGTEADQTWTETARPLDTAKANGKAAERTRAGNNAAAIRETSGYSTDAMASAAAQDPANRGTDVGNTIALQETVMDQLDTNLTAIEAATSVTDIAAVVDAPDLVMNTGRGNVDPLDMDPSHFPTINLGSVLESDLELYIPASDQIISYTTSLPSPYHFDMGNNGFTNDDQTIVVRIAATGVEVGRLECPYTGGGGNVDVDIYTAA